jgi:hypothetical protein
MLGSSTIAQSLVVHGQAKGKLASTTSACDLRAILALPPLHQLCDFLVAIRLRRWLDKHFGRNDAFFHGARPSTQTLDIATAVHLLLEKSHDSRAHGAVGEQDIRTFYDSVSLHLTTMYLLQNGCPPDIVGPLLRLQLLPKVFLRVGNAEFETGPRSAGVMTGTRCAGEIGRIPVEETLAATFPLLQRLGFQAGERKICVATYIDNIFTFSTGTAGAIQMAQAVADRLLQRLRLQIKDGGRAVISSDPDDKPEDANWSFTHTLAPLGHLVHWKCSVWPSIHKTVAQMWGIFFKRFRERRLKHLDISARCRLLSQHVEPILAFRSSGWPPTQQIIDLLDRLQLRMIAILLYVHPWPEEAIADFVRRRTKTATAIADSTGRWMNRYLWRFVNWTAHLRRNSNGQSFNKALLEYQDSEWLKKRREQYVPIFSINARAFTRTAGRTNTRAGVGGPSTRWEKGYDNALEILAKRPNNKNKTRPVHAIKKDAYLPKNATETIIVY